MSFKHLFAAKAITICSLSVSGAVHGIGWHHGISIGFASEQSDVSLSSNTQTQLELSNLSSSLADNISIQGYSISSDWAIGYQFEQHDTELADPTNKYKQQNAQLDFGISAFKLDSGLNLYPLLGIKHISADVLTHKFSSTQSYAGIRIDIPVFKRFFVHAKADTSLASEKSTNFSVAANYRYMRHHSIMLEWQKSSLELATRENASDVELDRDASQIALRWYLVW